jgi:hypothetical protein
VPDGYQQPRAPFEDKTVSVSDTLAMEASTGDFVQLPAGLESCHEDVIYNWSSPISGLRRVARAPSTKLRMSSSPWLSMVRIRVLRQKRLLSRLLSSPFPDDRVMKRPSRPCNGYNSSPSQMRWGSPTNFLNSTAALAQRNHAATASEDQLWGKE